MSIQHYLRDDVHFVIFSEIYKKHSSPKTKRQALEILDCSIKVLSKKGYRFTTLSMIAKSYGSSTSKILYYFDSLDDLKMETIKYTRYLFQSYLVEQLRRQTDPYKIFENYFTCCLEWPKKFPDHTALWISFLHQCAIEKNYREVNTLATKTGRERLIDLIKKGAQTKSFKCSDPESTAKIIHTLISGLILTNTTENQITESQSEKEIYLHCLNLLGVKAQ